MLTHVVLMKFKSDIDPAEIDKLAEQLDELPNTIMEILTYEFGKNIITTDRSYDFALVSNFANPEALTRYQNHPDHLNVLAKVETISENVITVDFEASDARVAKGWMPDKDMMDWK